MTAGKRLFRDTSTLGALVLGTLVLGTLVLGTLGVVFLLERAPETVQLPAQQLLTLLAMAGVAAAAIALCPCLSATVAMTPVLRIAGDGPGQRTARPGPCRRAGRDRMGAEITVLRAGAGDC
jgi:hypothetical protein